MGFAPPPGFDFDAPPSSIAPSTTPAWNPPPGFDLVAPEIEQMRQETTDPLEKKVFDQTFPPKTDLTDFIKGVRKESKALGMNPEHYLTGLLYESPGIEQGNFWEQGPRTKWGQHRGMFQWGEPQASQYGVHEGMSPAEQLAAGSKYLLDRGFKPGGNLLDFYSTINAGAPGRYSASDRPGETVQSHVQRMLAERLPRAQALLAQYPEGPPGGDGMLEPGNLDYTKLPMWPEGKGFKTMKSASFNLDGVEVLIPTVDPETGKDMTEEEALARYQKTGLHLGIFDNPDDATSYSKFISNEQNKRQQFSPPPGFDLTEPPEAPEKPGYLDSVAKGIDQLQQMGYAAVEGMGELTGLEGATQWGKSGREAEARELKNQPSSSLYDVEKPGDFLQWLKEMAGQQTPILGASAGSALAGSALGSLVLPGPGTVAGGLLGAFIPSFVMEFGTIQAGAKEKDPNAVADAWTVAGGTMAGLLDALTPGRLGSALTSKFGKEVAEEIAQSVWKRISKEGLKNATTEGITEATQEVIEEYSSAKQAKGPIDWESALKQAGEAGVAGAFLGGGLGAVEGAIPGKTKAEETDTNKLSPESLQDRIDAFIPPPGFTLTEPPKTDETGLAASPASPASNAAPSDTTGGAAAPVNVGEKANKVKEGLPSPTVTVDFGDNLPRFGKGPQEVKILSQNKDFIGVEAVDSGKRAKVPKSLWEQVMGEPRRRAELHKSLADLLASNPTDPEQIYQHPAMAETTFDQEFTEPKTIDRLRYDQGTGEYTKVYGEPGYRARRVFDIDGEKVVGYRKAVEVVAKKNRAFAGPKGVAKERHATIVIGAPGVGKSTLVEGKFAPARRAAVVDSDIWKKAMEEFKGGRGTQAVHKESRALAERQLSYHVERGENVIMSMTGQYAGGVNAFIQKLREANYKVDVVNITTDELTAARRIAKRYLETGRPITPGYARGAVGRASRTYKDLKNAKAADRFAEIDTTGEPAIVQDGEAVLDVEGLRDGRTRGNARERVQVRPGRGASQARSAGRLSRPRSGQSFSQWVASIGGIKDVGGNLKAMGAPEYRGIHGIINNKTGMHPDKAREAAVAAGFIRERPYAEEAQTTIDDLNDLVERTVAGEKIYAFGNEGVAEERKAREKQLHPEDELDFLVGQIEKAVPGFTVRPNERERAARLYARGLDPYDIAERLAIEDADNTGGEETRNALDSTGARKARKRAAQRLDKLKVPGLQAAQNAGRGKKAAGATESLAAGVKQQKAWVEPSDESLAQEYKIKQAKNDYLTKQYPTEKAWIEAVRRGRVVEVPPSLDAKIARRTHTKTQKALLDSMKGYASYPEFRNEKTLQRLYDKVKAGEPMDMPLIYVTEDGRMTVRAGNTRLDVAEQLGVTPKAILFGPGIDKEAPLAAGVKTVKAKQTKAQAIWDKLPEGEWKKMTKAQAKAIDHGTEALEGLWNFKNAEVVGWIAKYANDDEYIYGIYPPNFDVSGVLGKRGVAVTLTGAKLDLIDAINAELGQSDAAGWVIEKISAGQWGISDPANDLSYMMTGTKDEMVAEWKDMFPHTAPVFKEEETEEDIIKGIEEALKGNVEEDWAGDMIKKALGSMWTTPSSKYGTVGISHEWRKQFVERMAAAYGLSQPQQQALSDFVGLPWGPWEADKDYNATDFWGGTHQSRVTEWVLPQMPASIGEEVAPKIADAFVTALETSMPSFEEAFPQFGEDGKPISKPTSEGKAKKIWQAMADKHGLTWDNWQKTTQELIHWVNEGMMPSYNSNDTGLTKAEWDTLEASFWKEMNNPASAGLATYVSQWADHWGTVHDLKPDVVDELREQLLYQATEWNKGVNIEPLVLSDALATITHLPTSTVDQMGDSFLTGLNNYKQNQETAGDKAEKLGGFEPSFVVKDGVAKGWTKGKNAVGHTMWVKGDAWVSMFDGNYYYGTGEGDFTGYYNAESGSNFSLALEAAEKAAGNESPKPTIEDGWAVYPEGAKLPKTMGGDPVSKAYIYWLKDKGFIFKNDFQSVYYYGKQDDPTGIAGAATLKEAKQKLMDAGHVEADMRTILKSIKKIIGEDDIHEQGKKLGKMMADKIWNTSLDNTDEEEPTTKKLVAFGFDPAAKKLGDLATTLLGNPDGISIADVEDQLTKVGFPTGQPGGKPHPAVAAVVYNVLMDNPSPKAVVQFGPSEEGALQIAKKILVKGVGEEYQKNIAASIIGAYSGTKNQGQMEDRLQEPPHNFDENLAAKAAKAAYEAWGEPLVEEKPKATVTHESVVQAIKAADEAFLKEYPHLASSSKNQEYGTFVNWGYEDFKHVLTNVVSGKIGSLPNVIEENIPHAYKGQHSKAFTQGILNAYSDIINGKSSPSGSLHVPQWKLQTWASDFATKWGEKLNLVPKGHTAIRLAAQKWAEAYVKSAGYAESIASQIFEDLLGAKLSVPNAEKVQIAIISEGPLAMGKLAAEAPPKVVEAVPKAKQGIWQDVTGDSSYWPTFEAAHIAEMNNGDTIVIFKPNAKAENYEFGYYKGGYKTGGNKEGDWVQLGYRPTLNAAKGAAFIEHAKVTASTVASVKDAFVEKWVEENNQAQNLVPEARAAVLSAMKKLVAKGSLVDWDGMKAALKAEVLPEGDDMWMGLLDGITFEDIKNAVNDIIEQEPKASGATNPLVASLKDWAKAIATFEINGDLQTIVAETMDALIKKGLNSNFDDVEKALKAAATAAQYTQLFDGISFSAIANKVNDIIKGAPGEFPDIKVHTHAWQKLKPSQYDTYGYHEDVEVYHLHPNESSKPVAAVIDHGHPFSDTETQWRWVLFNDEGTDHSASKGNGWGKSLADAMEQASKAANVVAGGTFYPIEDSAPTYASPQDHPQYESIYDEKYQEAIEELEQTYRENYYPEMGEGKIDEPDSDYLWERATEYLSDPESLEGALEELDASISVNGPEKYDPKLSYKPLLWNWTWKGEGEDAYGNEYKKGDKVAEETMKSLWDDAVEKQVDREIEWHYQDSEAPRTYTVTSTHTDISDEEVYDSGYGGDYNWNGKEYSSETDVLEAIWQKWWEDTILDQVSSDAAEQATKEAEEAVQEIIAEEGAQIGGKVKAKIGEPVSAQATPEITYNQQVAAHNSAWQFHLDHMASKFGLDKGTLTNVLVKAKDKFNSTSSSQAGGSQKWREMFKKGISEAFPVTEDAGGLTDAQKEDIINDTYNWLTINKPPVAPAPPKPPPPKFKDQYADNAFARYKMDAAILKEKMEKGLDMSFEAREARRIKQHRTTKAFKGANKEGDYVVLVGRQDNSSYDYNRGAFFSSSAEVASEWAGGGVVYPVWLRTKGWKVIDMHGQSYSAQGGNDTKIKQARQEGYTGLWLKNVNDTGGTADQLIAWTTSDIRSVHARFDEEDDYSGDILAAGVRSVKAPLRDNGFAKLREIAQRMKEATAIVTRIAGPIEIVWHEIIPASMINLQYADTSDGETLGGYYRPARAVGPKGIPADALIGLAHSDPDFDLLTVAGHEAFHHVERALASPTEMALLNDPRELARIARIAAAEIGKEAAARMPYVELRAYAYQRYRRMKEEGADNLSRGLNPNLVRLWERIRQFLRRVHNLLRGMGYDTFEDIFEDTRKGLISQRNPRSGFGLAPHVANSLAASLPRDRGLGRKAIEHFGRTQEASETGYILPGGERLDLSGRHQSDDYEKAGEGYRTRNVLKQGRRDYGEFRGQRYVDHRELDGLVPSKPEGVFADELVDFMGRAHAIRWYPGVGAEASFMPTEMQIRKIVHGFKSTAEPWSAADPTSGIQLDLSDPRTGETLESGNVKPTLETVTKWFKEATKKHDLFTEEPGPEETLAAGIRRVGPEHKDFVTPPPKQPPEKWAGNINLDKIESSEDVPGLLQQMAEHYEGYMEARGGRISHARTRELAAMMGIDPSKLAKKRRHMPGLREAEMFAIRNAMVAEGQRIFDLAEKARYGSDEDKAALLKERARLGAIAEYVAGETAYAGRLLNQFKMIAGQDKELMASLLDQQGQTLDQFIDRVLSLKDPTKIAAFSNRSLLAKTADVLFELWVNALLSGPVTHATNAFSNTLVAVYQVPEAFVASLISKVTGSGIPLSDATYRAFGLMQGIGDGIKAGAQAFKTEEPTGLTGKIEAAHPKAIPNKYGGRFFRAPGLGLLVADEFYKAINYRAEINSRALRMAVAEGLKGRALAQRVADLVANPTDRLMRYGRIAAERQTFTNKAGKIAQIAHRAVASIPALRYVIPFIRTPANIASFALRRSPFAPLFADVRADLKGENGAQARDEAIARMALGSAVSALAIYWAAQGLITGGGPDDPRERSLLYATGWQPYSIKIGGTYYSFARFEPLSTLLGVAADAYELRQAMEGDEKANIPALLIGSITRNLTSKTFLRGLSEVFEVTSDPTRYGPIWVKNFAGTLVPTGVAQLARTRDPYLREARGILDNIKSRIPGLRETLTKRRDPFGEEIKKEGALGPDIVSPMFLSSIKDNPAAQEMIRLGYAPGMPGRKIMNVELSPEQYEAYAIYAGRNTKEAVDKIMSKDSYSRLPDDEQKYRIKKAVDAARREARYQVIKDFSDLKDQIRALKRTRGLVVDELEE